MLHLFAQSCPNLCDSTDCSPPGSSVHGDSQARILEWVAMPSSRGSSQPRSLSLQVDSLLSQPQGSLVYVESVHKLLGVPKSSVVKNLPANTGDTGSIPGSRRSPGEGSGHRLQYSCLEHPRDRGSWWATVHGVAKSLTQLSTTTT